MNYVQGMGKALGCSPGPVGANNNENHENSKLGFYFCAEVGPELYTYKGFLARDVPSVRLKEEWREQKRCI